VKVEESTVGKTRERELEQATADFLHKQAVAMDESLSRGDVGQLPDLPGDLSYGELLDLMKTCHVYRYPKVDNTADAVVFGINTMEGCLNVLLIERGRESEPFFGHWALPGGFVNMGEDLDTTVLRELEEETGVKLSYMEQLATFSAPDRDPRGRVVTTAYLGLVRPEDVTIGGFDDAAKAMWFSVTGLPKLAFDHRRIIREGLRRLRSKVRWQPVGIDLLPEEFTLTQLQQVYETVLQRELDKRTFRKKVKKFDVLVDTGKKRGNGHRPAKLYRFDRDAYQRLVSEGMDFEV